MSTDYEALGDWLAAYLGNYTLPANYAAPLYGQTHREVAKYVGPVIAEDLLESTWLRDHDAALTARAKAEALREAAEWLPVATEGTDRAGTETWRIPDRDIYSLAIEEAQVALRERADRESR